jgi:hypothetical protein
MQRRSWESDQVWSQNIIVIIWYWYHLLWCVMPQLNIQMIHMFWWLHTIGNIIILCSHTIGFNQAIFILLYM